MDKTDHKALRKYSVSKTLKVRVANLATLSLDLKKKLLFRTLRFHF